jgi:hypothetical protein
MVIFPSASIFASSGQPVGQHSRKAPTSDQGRRVGNVVAWLQPRDADDWVTGRQAEQSEARIKK